MSQIIYPITHLPPVIDIGKQTEKGVTRIGFDMHEWLDDWPEMKFSVQPTRPGEKESYFADTEMVGSVIFWLVGAVDTEKPGSGTVEVLGVTEDERKLSFMCRTSIANTNTATTAEIPEPNQPWVDRVIIAGETAKKKAKEASESAINAAHSEQAAGQYSANADTQAKAAAVSAKVAAESEAEAIKAKDKAIAQADDAEASAKSAQESRLAAAADASKAEAGATNAQAFSADAKTHAEDASASASSAASSANAAKSSETAAASSEKTATSQANNAATSATVASQNASIASSRAKEAAASATAAKTSESNAKASETAAAKSESAAAASAAAAKESETGAAASAALAAENAQDLYIIRYANEAIDRTYAEIEAAIEAGKACILVTGLGEVLNRSTAFGDGLIFSVLYNSPNEAFPGLWMHDIIINKDGTVSDLHRAPAMTPNPKYLFIRGAVEAEYNGSAQVEIEIPSGEGRFIVNATEVTAESPGEGLLFASTAKLDKTFAETTAAFRAGQQVVLVAENLMGEGEKWHIPAVMCTDDSLTLFQRVPGLDIVGNFNQDGTMNVSGFAT